MVNGFLRGSPAPNAQGVLSNLCGTVESFLKAQDQKRGFGVQVALRGCFFEPMPGLFFVLGQAYEYYHLMSHGTTIPGSAYGTVFYLATGFHGLHVTGGLIAFIFLLARTAMSKFTPAQATASIVVSYYWHFVDIVWIALFTVIYFIQ